MYKHLSPANTHPRDTYIKPHPRDTYIKPHPRDTYIKPHPRDTYIKPHPRDTYIKPHPRDTYIKPHPRDTYIKPHPRDTYIKPHPRDTYIKPLFGLYQSGPLHFLTKNEAKSEGRLSHLTTKPCLSLKSIPLISGTYPFPFKLSLHSLTE
uniref:Uncharacterized protein n=1 Tax=Hucho hucho TaxID=62062 RepID=A0A4W5N9N4_9TELE